MKTFLYTVWFRNSSAEEDDQDKEWPACIEIEADKDLMAKEWGDHLSLRYSQSHLDEILIKSSIEETIEDKYKKPYPWLPHIQYGYEASDLEIGW